ncbi:hypothetical protein [Flavihumibacter petaseus]|uniref:Lipid/polyisoprenoid-binding YceI-like domain-containing protein n=1 Tax=Flavihumibacter petaseus NBRC 106054 TaxID=1220578 RepID=A0A0E9N0Q7_9BACT|nr:hypothetical protein [Flavihumibacter petaseus]GAO43231.1 hypothetical protein FPE01S_02_03350 [Flavihumibacter petaseus NBRC 106054]
MKQLTTALLVAISFFILPACQKEISFETPNASPNNPANPNDPDDPNQPGGGGNLVGVYDFIDMAVKGTTKTESRTGGMTMRSTAYLDYTSINNKGVLTLTENKVTSKGLGYDVKQNIRIESQVVGIPGTVPLDFPMDESFPPSDAEGDYVLKGADSIKFTGFNINPPVNASGLEGKTNTTMKYRWDGDILILNDAYIDSNSPDPSVTVSVDIKMTVRYKKRP